MFGQALRRCRAFLSRHGLGSGDKVMRKENKDNQLYELENKPVGRLLWQYSLPAIVGILVMSLYNVVDRIFIGQGVGPEAIAGLAITFPVMNLVTALGVLIGGGAAARTSIVLGRGDHDRAFRILGNSLTMTFVLGVVYISVFTIFLDPILLAFGASENTLPYARDFMLYIMPGLLIINLCYSFNNIMRAVGYPTKAMVTMFIGAGINVILAPTFIFGLGWGIKGAAIATDIAMTISAVFVMSHFLSKKNNLYFRRGTYKPEPAILISIMSIGAAPFLVNVAGCVINAIVNNSLFRYGGDDAVAAMGIFTTFTQLIVVGIIGLCQGMQPIVGYNFGARRFDRLTRTYWLCVGVASVLCVVGWGICQLCPHLIARAFTTDAGLIEVTGHALAVTTSVFMIVGFQIVSTNFFQSLGYAGKSIFLSLTRQVIFLLPLLFTLPRKFGLDGVWASFPSSDVLATFTTAVMVVIQFRQLKKMAAAARPLRD